MADLKAILVSKVRVKLLMVFFSNANEIFYVRQLVRMTNEEINAVRRELENLLEFGLLQKEQRGNRLYYFLNPKSLYFEDLLSIICKSTDLGAELIRLRPKLGKIKAIFWDLRFALKQPFSSDKIDIVIIADVVMPEITKLIADTQKSMKREINYTVMDINEYEYRKSKRDPFVIGCLMMAKIMIIGSQADLS